MATYVQTKAVVLGHRELAEHDRLYTLFTEARGKLEVRVRGARKLLSKLSPPLASIGVVRALLYEGRSRPLLLGVESWARFPETNVTLWRARFAARFLRLVDLSTRTEARDPELFHLLTDALAGVEHASPERIGTLRDAFILKLLSHAGYRPELDRCVGCRRLETDSFSAAHGGAACRTCAAGDLTAVPVDTADLEALRAHTGLPLAAGALLPPRDLGAITQSLLRYRLETPLWFPAFPLS